MPVSSQEPEGRRPSEVFGSILRAVRKPLTQAQMAERMAQIGAHVHPATIARIEKGERSVTLEEVFEFARALGTSPWYLFLPLSGEGAIRVGDKSYPPGAISEWLSADEPKLDADDPFEPPVGLAEATTMSAMSNEALDDRLDRVEKNLRRLQKRALALREQKAERQRLADAFVSTFPASMWPKEPPWLVELLAQAVAKSQDTTTTPRRQPRG